MKDMIGVLFLCVFPSQAVHCVTLTSLRLKNVGNDRVIAPDGISIEDRLKPLLERTADDIKSCSNACDAYMKKRLLAKVLLSSVWDAKLLDFMKTFTTRREEFKFELTIHTSQGVDKANSKLDVIGDAVKALDEKFERLPFITVVIY
jgi:hypothetical protein